MIGRITAVLSEAGLNIENMANKSRDKRAYTLLEVTGDVTADIVAELEAIPEVIRVRVMPPLV